MNKRENNNNGKSLRLPNWDYRWAASYFITICTKNKYKYFGEINKGKLIYSRQGVLAEVLWTEIIYHARNIELGEFVVMPDHFHGILTLKGEISDFDLPDPNQSYTEFRFQNQGKNSVSSIVGSFKSAVTKHAHRMNMEFCWQSNYYEHIIRTQKAFDAISKYIKDNPEKWRSK